tara:strand:+ start:463 stop:747 length:285 start_codon:yes stop_codon:yes gene_type:complete
MSEIEEIVEEIVEEEENVIEEHLQFLINYKDMLEQSISTMKNKIENNTGELEKIKEYLSENCEHNIEIDYIDTMQNGETMSQMIKYCKKCELSF